MQLSDFRTQFLEMSGRMDLDSAHSNTNLYKKKADFYIHMGAKYLDENFSIIKPRVRYVIDLSAGKHLLIIPRALVIKCVVAIAGLKELYYLEYGTEVPKQVFGQENSGIPKYWYIGAPMPGPTQHALTSSNYTDDATYIMGDQWWSGQTMPGLVGRYEATSLVISPNTDRLYSIGVEGDFYSRRLFEDTDINFWSQVHTDLLLYASLMKLESFYRNTAGMADWLNALNMYANGALNKTYKQQVVEAYPGGENGSY